jgi:hypothetical protein
MSIRIPLSYVVRGSETDSDSGALLKWGGCFQKNCSAQEKKIHTHEKLTKHANNTN